MTPCILCGCEETIDYYRDINHHFLECRKCTSIFREPATWVTAAAEKARYLTHKNDVDNLGYQRFVSPIVEAVQANFDSKTSGLDFGAGTGPVAAKLLSEQGYSLTLYDPFFYPNKEVLNRQYDYIICCEVIEHFHHPLQEFQLLKRLLKPNGMIFCMTDLWNDSVEQFRKWYYKNDRTHVIFYNEQNLKWVANEVGFTNVSVDGRLIILL